MTQLHGGIGGSLFPRRYIADRLGHDAGAIDVGQDGVRLSRWWARVADTCGPVTSLRALFDLAAMPLFAVLGFRASRPVFDRHVSRVRLDTRRGGCVSLLLLPWASRPSSAWRAAVAAAEGTSAEWCFVFAPPFLSIVGVRGVTLRRSVDFQFPAALGPPGLSAFLTLTRAEAFDRAGAGGAGIDRLVATAASFQDRVRSDLQHGVVDALAALTPVFRQRSQGGAQDPFDEALAVLYRVLFLLFAESRDLVPHWHPIYHRAYALGTLCRHAQNQESSRGLWDALAAVTRLSRLGCRVDDLIVRPFNGRLFARATAPTLEAGRTARRPTRLSASRDEAIRRALVALATRPAATNREEICYADLGVEQLGAVYERVLDLHHPGDFVPPDPLTPGDRAARVRRSSGHSRQRKQTGTFYTPQDLAEFVVRRTLAPLVAGRPADDILALRVVDPAMGSGAFLVAACHYLAAAYERALVDEGRCSAADVGPAEQAAMRRLVAERCLAGVDVNPTAVQLARLSLWLATLAEGKPLGFLDHRLRVGNSLIGASPEDVRRIPDRPRAPRPSTPLFDDLELELSVRRVTRPLRELTTRPDDTVEDVRAKEALWAALAGESSPLAPWRRAADLWCARWFWPVENGTGPAAPSAAEVRAAIDAVLKGDGTLRTLHLSRWLAVAAALGAARRFFHWPLEFADVFYDEAGQPKTGAGFDAVIGNPPWEMVRHDPGAGPRQRDHAEPNRQFVRFVRDSGLYPSCDRGHVNLYQPFLERSLALARAGGRVGLVLPWGLASDEGAATLRARLLDEAAMDTIVGFDNAGGLFPIHRGMRFLVVVASPGGAPRDIRARFGVKTREAIAALSGAADGEPDRSSYPMRLSSELLARVGGPSRRIPDARQAEDLEFLERLAERFPRLGAPGGWHARFGRELNATEDRAHFGQSGLPILEGKHVRPCVVDLAGAAFRIASSDAARLLPSRPFARARLAYRDVSGVANRFALIAAIVPAGVVTTHTLFCLRTDVPVERQWLLCGLFNSYVLNAVVRLLMGGHVTTSLVESLPAPAWTGSALQRRIARLAERLSQRPGATNTQALLQGAVARLYGVDLDAFTHLLSGLPLVPAEERTRARAAFQRLHDRLRYSPPTL